MLHDQFTHLYKSQKPIFSWGEQTFAPYPTPPTPLLTRARARKRAHAREQFNK